MRGNKVYFFITYLICLLVLLPGANAGSFTFYIENGLPLSQLVHCNDAFDELRKDIWEPSQTPHYGTKISRMPDFSIEDGQLKIQTRTGHFSKGGLQSKYSLRGDFDIQVDCHMDFMGSAPGMDQVLQFVIEEKQNKSFSVIIGLAKKAKEKPVIFSLYQEKRKPLPTIKWHPTGNFHGALRIVRIGNKSSTLYRKKGVSEWRIINTFQGITGDVVLGLGMKNYSEKRTAIQSELPVTGKFDNFKITAAQEIIDETGLGPSPVSGGCDKAPHFFWKGQFASQKEKALEYYLKAIELCPGFIRPYELAGNIYRKQGQGEKAMEFFIKASELGTNNYKLYYLLAGLSFKKGDLNGASRHIKKSLDIRGDYEKALRLKEKIEKALDRDGPKIVLFEPSTRRGMKIVHEYENLTVRGLATDKNGIAQVKVNQLEASIDEHGNFLKDIPIRVGSNTIKVEAADNLGNRSSISITIQGTKYTLPALSKFDSPILIKDLYGKSFAVVIGINNYEKWPSLEFAVADAGAVREKLEATGFDKVTTILDKEATQRRILTELFHELPKKVGRNDRVMFYFAGHGQTETLPGGGKKGYIIPVDADMSNYSSTAISMEQVRSLSRRIPAKHILFVMDSCYSGLGLSRSTGISPKISDYLRKVSSMRVVQIITAGGKGEQVQEKVGHGLFTTYFLRALMGEADINKDNVVTGTELGAYLRPTVSNASNQAQTPLYGRLEGEGEFLLFVGKK